MSEEPTLASSREISSGQADFASSATKREAHSTGPTPISDHLSDIICDVILQRARGERISDEQVIASHPDLMPRLREELLALGSVHQVVVSGQDQVQTVSSVEGEAAELMDRGATMRGLSIRGYCIEREINSGGQATVYKAVHERTGRCVAIKVMHGGPYVGSRGRKRFERESNILAGLNHPNIVGILDRGRTEDGSFFLVMDFIEGRQLDQFVPDLKKNSNAVVELFIKIAKALEETHRHGIVHRDLKPMNILVDDRHEPHILDFGMARLLQSAEQADEQTSLTRTGQVLGSLPWTSPEQVFGSPNAIDARSDVYALGVMLFAALAGEFPYPVTGAPGTVTQHIRSSPPSSLLIAAKRNGGTVNLALEQIVLKSLSKSPKERYASAGAMARDLKECLAGKSPVHSPWSIHQLRPVALLASLLLCFVISSDGKPPANATGSFVNTVGMRFVKISPGAAPLAKSLSQPTETDYQSNPWVRIDHSFFMSETVVTQEQYLRVTGRNPSDPSLVELQSPVQCITWADANAFCDALSRRENRKYRLPTVDEWSYAFLSGGFGSSGSDNFEGSEVHAIDATGHLRPVETTHPNRWGLYDLTGEVRQWCEDSRVPSVKATSHDGVSTHLAAGSDFLTSTPSASPLSEDEKKFAAQTSILTIGFRVVCETP